MPYPAPSASIILAVLCDSCLRPSELRDVENRGNCLVCGASFSRDTLARLRAEFSDARALLGEADGVDRVKLGVNGVVTVGERE